MEIGVNPDCSKCRAATEALDDVGVACTVRRSLDQPPTRAELEDVLARLGLEPWHITRIGESEAIVVRGLPRTEEAGGEWPQALVDHPRLIQRPIITADDGTAVVGRDAESLSRIPLNRRIENARIVTGCCGCPGPRHAPIWLSGSYGGRRLTVIGRHLLGR